MSAATPISSADYLRGLPRDAKPAVLAALLAEAAAATGGHALIPLYTSDGQPHGIYVPPALADRHARAMAPVLSAERQAAVARAVETPGDTFDMDSFLDALSREDRG